MKTVVLVGNPKPASRTLNAAVLLAEGLAGKAPDTVIDLATIGADLLDGESVAMREAVDAVCGADLLIVASPTFKASFSGIIKLFLDQIPPTGLADVNAIPLMLGASEKHALAVELHLKPVLVEAGACCPTPGCYLLQSGWQNGEGIRDFSKAFSHAVRAHRLGAT